MKHTIEKLKKAFLDENEAKGDLETDSIFVVVMQQVGPYGVIKIDDNPVKATTIDIEELQNFLEEAKDLQKC